MTWVIQVMKQMNGREYPTVIEQDRLNGKTAETQRIPRWRLVTIPPEFAHLDPISILQACYAARIDWKKEETHVGTPNRPSSKPDTGPDQ